VNEILKHFFGALAWYDGKLYLSARRTLSSATLTIGPSQIIRPLTWSRIPLHQRPNYVDVIYTDSTSWQQQKKNSAASGINRNSTTCRAVEVNLPGCTVASMAKRYAEQYRKLLTNETLLVDFSITSVGVQLNPGDRVDVTTPTGLSSQQIRVDTITALESGEYLIRGTSYDSTAQSTTTDTAASVPSTTVPGTNVLPAAPTSVSCTYYSLTLTDQFGNDIGYARVNIAWTAGSGGDAVAAWAFECRDSTDATPDSTIQRSDDILYVPAATECTWTNDFEPDYFAYNADFAKASPGWTGSALVDFDEVRVIAIGEHGGETVSSWVTLSASAMSPQTATGGFIDLPDTPSAYTGNAGKYLRVNSGPNAIEFADVSASAPANTDMTRDQTSPALSGAGYWDALNESGSGYVVLIKNDKNNGTDGDWTKLKVTVDGTQLFELTSITVSNANEVAIGPGSVLNLTAPIYYSSSVQIEVYSANRTSTYARALRVWGEW
jgi:archaellum component FlaG (FlaF/FlaG flagellin family)